MGPRIILVEDRGQIQGLITIKDILKHVASSEQNEKEDISVIQREDLGTFLEEMAHAINEGKEILLSWIAGRGWRPVAKQPVELSERESLEELHELRSVEDCCEPNSLVPPV